MQYVGEDQFLVLLLVVQPQFDQRRRGFPRCFARVTDQPLHG